MTPFPPIRLLLVLFLSIMGFGLYADTEDDFRWRRDVRPIMRKHCSSCHNLSEKKGGINLDDTDFAIGVTQRGELYQNVVRQIQAGTMPPMGKPRMSPEEMEQTVAGINRLLDKALSEPDPGDAIMRRMSHREYRYAILDITGIDFDAKEFFPSEGSGGEGFDNQSRILFFTPLLIERYYEAADSILRATRRDEKLWRKIVPQTYTPGLGAQISFWWNEQVLRQENSMKKPVEAAGKVLIPFATTAYRRFLTQAEIDQMMDFFRDMYVTRWKEKDGFDKAIFETLKTILISPNFLYRSETNLTLKKPYPISNFELATRLSFLLWSSIPDSQLLDVAYRENLHDPAVIQRETLRMMADPRFMRFAEAFSSQWLGVEQAMNEPKTDTKKFPEFDEALRKAMYQEVVQYFYHVFNRSRNLLELIDSDYTYLNGPLARHYGIEGVEGEEMRAVLLTDRNRGGVLGMGAVLTASSLPTRTSPVLRGKWVLEQMLGTPPPPPPPDVPELEDAKKSVKNELDLRELLSLHRAPSTCAGCHQKMDPIGLGLENFDAIGRWRQKYGETPIDASGVLVTGQKFEGPAALKDILCEDKEKFARNLSRKLLSYALGRGVSFTDTPTLTNMTNSLLENDFDSQNLMLTLVTAYPFHYKRSDMPERYNNDE
ncbi:MAG: DUF1592 domain-containing protein [Bacteroidia bacterium]|nr:DUF1592 domain-containing protein [Bacteroidia bacterium]